MANITEPRDSGRILGEHEFSDPVKAGIKLIKGAMYGVDANGYAVHAESGTASKARGEVMYTVDNTDGDDGDVKVRGRAGVFKLFGLSGSAPTRADMYAQVYFQDDQTVSTSSNSGARPVAGILMDVVNGRPFVAVGAPTPADGDLVAANNLSDVASAATSRANIGANKEWVHLGQVSTKASDAAVLRAPAMADGTLLKIKTILNGALATADATVQAKVNGSNAGSTTTGLVTITQSGSAAGDVDSASPATTNVALVEDDVISILVGGGSTATGTAEVYALISY
jgi:hypothetical protein